MRHIKSCKPGDTIMDSTGGKALVLGRLGLLIFRSEYFRYDLASQRSMTVEEAEKQGWKLLDKDGRESMTQKEAERLLNVNITK